MTMLNEYASEPKSEKIRQLRELFLDKQDSTKTEAEKAYAQKLSTSNPAKLKTATIKELLKFHWSSYDYDTWTRAMDNIADLLRLEECETVYEAGFGTGAPLSYFNAEYHVGVSGNDFHGPFVQLAQESAHIGDGAFVHANSQDLKFITNDALDAVLAWGSIGYEDEEGSHKVIKELIRICKPGGRILIGNIDNSEKPTPYPSAYQTPFSKGELERMMESEPVEIIRLDTDQEVIDSEGHAAEYRLTICMEKTT